MGAVEEMGCLVVWVLQRVSCYFCFFFCLLDLRSGECNVVSMYGLCYPVNGSVCFVCCVFVNMLVKQFAICLGVFVILLLNVMDFLSVVAGALLDRPCMVFHRMCVLCLWSQLASRCSFYIFCLCFLCRKLSPHL